MVQSCEAGLLLKQQGVTVNHVFTSVLQRAVLALGHLSFKCPVPSGLVACGTSRLV